MVTASDAGIELGIGSATDAAQSEMPAQPQPALPTLRENLQLMPGAPMEDGAPAWLLYDPLRNAYYQLGVASVQLLNHWQSGQAMDAFLEDLATQGIDVDEEQLKGFLRFLQANQLLVVSGDQARQGLLQMKANKQRSWWAWLIHNYLFIKIPLWRPDGFLQATLPWVNFCFDSRFLWLIRLLGMLGIVLAMRQWETFSNTFLHFFSWQGMALYGVTLVLLKSAHELGHAYTAARQGCRVASIGVAFLVMFPMLYTDTTDAWRLRNKHDRLAIVLAGIKTEVHLALLATFLWSFLPDGPMRSAAFFVATTSWLTSLAVNISPFMRFDGYFAMSDILGASNLQPRAFAVARWRLREILFGWKDEVPERLSEVRQSLFIWYAWGTWVYRFFLFLGIALLVYNFAFKVLGIILFLVEIIWFVLLPIWKELLVWRERKADMRLNKQTFITLSLLGGLIALAVMPWEQHITVPAVMAADKELHVYAPENGSVLEIHASNGQNVEQGDLLAVLHSQELQQLSLQANIELDNIRKQLSRLAGNSQTKAQRQVLEKQIDQLQQRISGLNERQQSLKITAPLAGQVYIPESLSKGQWVAKEQTLLSVVDGQTAQVTALLNDQQIMQLGQSQGAQAQASWLSDRGLDKRQALQIDTIETAAIAALPWLELAADYGGPIAARPIPGSQNQQLRPETALYRVVFTLTDAQDQPTLLQRELGQVRLQVEPVSWVERWYKHIAAVLVRESGF